MEHTQVGFSERINSQDVKCNIKNVNFVWHKILITEWDEKKQTKYLECKKRKKKEGKVRKKLLFVCVL